MYDKTREFIKNLREQASELESELDKMQQVEENIPDPPREPKPGEVWRLDRGVYLVGTVNFTNGGSITRAFNIEDGNRFSSYSLCDSASAKEFVADSLDAYYAAKFAANPPDGLITMEKARQWAAGAAFISDISRHSAETENHNRRIGSIRDGDCDADGDLQSTLGLEAADRAWQLINKESGE